ncbi:MAG: hypothetical protein IJW75_01030 [Alphaproteobacteria bacterium]|nr:hypothetical protein [Alphaproteobacteria bacterium]
MSDIGKKNYTVRETVELTRSQISGVIAQMATRCVNVITKAYEDKKIDNIQYESLMSYFSNPDTIYRHTYRAIYDLFKQPEATCAIDLETGKVERNENGRPIDYGLKAVTPFTNTQLVYYDKFHNPIRVIFPMMKEPSRAIEKLLYEYGKEYNQDLDKISALVFENEDRESYSQALQTLNTPTSKLHDILRLTVTCKYKTDLERACNIFQKNRTIYTKDTPDSQKTGLLEEKRIKKEEPYFIIEEEKRNRFKGKIKDNNKMYYDIKIVLHIPDENGTIRDVEIQFKIHTLFFADIRTHKLYEEVRNIEKMLEKEGAKMDAKEIAQANARKKILLNRITQINKNAIHQYNMMVVDKIRRIEEDGYIPIGAEPEHTDGTYQWCREFLFKEYMPESLDDFKANESFNPNDELNKMCFLRMIGKLEPDFDEFNPLASEQIEQAYSLLKPSEIERYEKIFNVSNRYSQIIQNAINKKRIEDNGFPSPALTNLGRGY